MRPVLRVAWDVVLDAWYRRWLQVVVGLIVGLGLLLAFGLEISTVNDMVVSVRWLGRNTLDGMRAVDVLAAEAVAEAGIGLCTVLVQLGVLTALPAFDLSRASRLTWSVVLPVQRWQLIIGTHLGVMFILGAIALLLGVSGSLLLGAKLGVWLPGCLVGVSVGWLVASGIGGLAVLVLVATRSAIASIVVSGGVPWLVLTEPAWYRERDDLLDHAHRAITWWLPQLLELRRLGPILAFGEPGADALGVVVLATLLCGMGCVALAASLAEWRDL